MLKKILIASTIGISFLTTLLILVRSFKSPDQVVNGKEGSETLKTEAKISDNTKKVVYNQKEYSVEIALVENLENLNLLPNFDEKSTSSDIFSNNNCSVLVNGGFYTENYDPVGLFISNGLTQRSWQENSLFNGVLSVNSFLTPRITREVPGDSLNSAIQSGPVLIENVSVQKLSIKNDKPARRVVAAVDGNNALLFIVAYSSSSVFTGPYLADLPEVISLINEEFNLNIADAINLDGGSASAFITRDTKLTELSPAGSFFCYTESDE